MLWNLSNPHAAEADAARLVAQLKSNDPSAAEQAAIDLLKLGAPATRLLRDAAAQSADANFKKRAGQVADQLEVRLAVSTLDRRWGDRWYSVQAKGVNVGWFHMKVEKNAATFVLSDEFVAKVDQANEMQIVSKLTAQPDEFLTPIMLTNKHEGPGASIAVELNVAAGRATMVLNGQRKEGQDAGSPLPARFVTDKALMRLVTLMPQTDGYPVQVFDTLMKAKPRLIENGAIKFDKEELLDYQGRQVKTRLFRFQAENFPETLYWVDAEGRLLKVQMMGGVELLLSDEKNAKNIKVSELKPPPVVHTNPKSPREVPPLQGLPVFPGAEGFGTRTKAGRGGKVIEVTSLADHGPGSLREALNDPDPRTIVFRVSGCIELQEDLVVNHPFVTVAGQTAPGGGILVKNNGLCITSHDVLIQHLRIRPGSGGKGNPDDNDAICLLGPDKTIEGACNVVLDHISASWGEDETVSVVNGAHDVTICWSIVSEALNKSRHSKVNHSAGLLVGYGAEHVSIHHNLLAHNGFRNPLIKDGGTHDVVNNVIYNWGTSAAQVYDDDANTFLNFAGNSFLAGPSTLAFPKEFTVESEPKKGKPEPRIFLFDNSGPHRGADPKDEWSLAAFGWGEQDVPKAFRMTEPFKTFPITRMPAKEAVEKVLAQAGATAPHRDAVDQRVLKDVKDRTGRIIDKPEDAGGYPEIAAGTPPADSDHDGMPDAWEKKMGLNPNDPTDGKSERMGTGYTNLEAYLHERSVDQ
ncbi:MAG: hypothetical protein HY291_06740 [Planctomycetes bacterium]|nr:hypothetical protein [Planctomycetota bacterium]